MDKQELRLKAVEIRNSLFEQAILDRFFLTLEYVEDGDNGQAHFAEYMINSYLDQSKLFLDQLEKELEAKLMHLPTVECLMMKLKGGSASTGARKFNAIVNEMCQIFKRGETERLTNEFQKVKTGHAVLKTQLVPYAELLHQLRDDVPPRNQLPPQLRHQLAMKTLRALQAMRWSRSNRLSL